MLFFMFHTGFYHKEDFSVTLSLTSLGHAIHAESYVTFSHISFMTLSTEYNNDVITT